MTCLKVCSDIPFAILAILREELEAYKNSIAKIYAMKNGRIGSNGSNCANLLKNCRYIPILILTGFIVGCIATAFWYS